MSGRAMRIGIVAFSDFNAYPLGGGLTFLREFIRGAQACPDVEILLVGWGAAQEPDSSEQFVRIGEREYPFVRVGSGRPPTLVPDRLVFHANRGAWKSAMRRIGSVDVLYCHSPEAVLGVIKGGAGVPLALHLHGSRDAVGRSRFLVGRLPPVRWLYRRIFLEPALRSAHAVLATVSSREHELLKASSAIRPGVPCVRIPGMVSEDQRPAVRDMARTVLRLVCVGRLERVKGVDLPIAAVAEIAGRGVDCVLEILGDGAERDRLVRVSKSMGVSGRVRFRGKCEHGEVAHIVSQADVFVSGSRQEGFSLALLEALALGTPAVVTNVGSAADVVIPGETGIILDGRNPVRFADAVLQVARLGDGVRVKCRARAMAYSGKQVAEHIIHVLRGIVRHPQPAQEPDEESLADVERVEV